MMSIEEYKRFEKRWQEIKIGNNVELNIAGLYHYTKSKIKEGKKEFPTYLSFVIYPSKEGKIECEYGIIDISIEVDDDTNCEYYDYCLYTQEDEKYCGSTSILYPTIVGKILDIEKNGNIIFIQFDNDDYENGVVEIAFTKDEFFAAASEHIHGGKDAIPTF